MALTAPGAGRITGNVRSVRYMGAVNRVTVAIPEGELTATITAGRPLPAQGESVGLDWAPDALHEMEGGA
jgi:hypothetical protein